MNFLFLNLIFDYHITIIISKIYFDFSIFTIMITFFYSHCDIMDKYCDYYQTILLNNFYKTHENNLLYSYYYLVLINILNIHHYYQKYFLHYLLKIIISFCSFGSLFHLIYFVHLMNLKEFLQFPYY